MTIPPCSLCHARHFHRRGFSLVEVTLALGIVAFAATTILAMLPIALRTLRFSNEQTVEAQISEELSSNLLQTPFSQLPANAAFYFYDNEGTLLNPSGTAIDSASNPPIGTIFTAELDPSTPSYPGFSGTGSGAATAMQLFTAKITTRESKNQSSRYQDIFSILIARREALVSS